MEEISTKIYNISCRTLYVGVAGFKLRAKRIEPQVDSFTNNRPTLVFLHEGLGCIELWRDFPEVLCASTGCPGLVYDRRGYGGSEKFTGKWPMDYLFKEASVFLPQLLKACDIDDVILIGHSDGGTIALITSATHGNVVRGVITEAAHIFVENITLAGIRKAVENFESRDLRKKLFRYHKENTDTIFRRWADRWLSPEFFKWNIKALLPEITCPLLVLQGEDDPYGTSAQVRGITSRVSGQVDAKLIPNCGHVPHFQARNTVLYDMTDFIMALIRK